MQIHQIKNNNEKQTVTKEILEALPEWFGNSEAREEYIKESGEFTCFCAYEDNKVMGKYASYDKTNLFYKHLGFEEFEVFPELWDKSNPCQIYVMALK